MENLFAAQAAAAPISAPNIFMAGATPGMIQPGNIDLTKRPVVKNADGSISTVRSMSFSPDGKHEFLIPTVSDDGKIMNTNDAIKYFYSTGKHLGIFADEPSATAYALKLHEQQASMYGPSK